MNILGTGIDIVDNSRFKKILVRKRSGFKNKIFSRKEINYCEKKNNFVNCYSKRFAAKEAFVKALGTGFRDGINYKDIEITNNSFGKPSLNIDKKISKKIRNIFKIKKFLISVSVSDEKKYSVASVIISQK